MPFQFRKEAIEEDLNTNFPSQGQGNPPLYYSLSEVVVPTYNINNVAEGTSLPQNLQTAWDFSTGNAQVEGTLTTIVSNTGFWQVDVSATIFIDSASVDTWFVDIYDGSSAKKVWAVSSTSVGSGGTNEAIVSDKFIVFLRSGDVLRTKGFPSYPIDVWYRQIADVNGNLVNPLGFSFA